MSGKRMISSVQITLVPPWRPESSQRKDPPTQHETPRLAAQLPHTPAPDTEELPWRDNKQVSPEVPIFPCSFLDDIPIEEDCLSPDLQPPPPPPPVFFKNPRNPHPDLPPPSISDLLSLELQKLELAHPAAHKKSSSVPSAQPPIPQNNTPVPTDPHRRDTVAPDKQNLNGFPAKQEAGSTQTSHHAPLTNDICAFCHKAIPSSSAVIEAMKKQYHANCFTCRKCSRLLAGQLYYQTDGQPLCEHCYKETLDKCAKCQLLIKQHIVRAMGNGYHPECFTCVVCQRRIADESFAVDEFNDVYCAEDYYRKFAPICSACNDPIIPKDGNDSYKIECLGHNYHENCYRCERCDISLSLEPTETGCFPLKGSLLCKSCHLSWKEELS
ncbi:filamin-binding LIM protein 1 isoform X2 [Xenopus laevis]|uniref:Filamin-binding LIM protein 1 isoform X2 n=1 Tax=Xenopus laevis TaxID=8355 RepID=A0A8J0T3V2_XENLA|nr:filamin-binding LIM protein 1 isoform X2 [Xenopus laevis]